MTVKELIAQLEDFNPEDPLYLDVDGDACKYDVEEVYGYMGEVYIRGSM